MPKKLKFYYKLIQESEDGSDIKVWEKVARGNEILLNYIVFQLRDNRDKISSRRPLKDIADELRKRGIVIAGQDIEGFLKNTADELRKSCGFEDIKIDIDSIILHTIYPIQCLGKKPTFEEINLSINNDIIIRIKNIKDRIKNLDIDIDERKDIIDYINAIRAMVLDGDYQLSEYRKSSKKPTFEEIFDKPEYANKFLEMLRYLTLTNDKDEFVVLGTRPPKIKLHGVIDACIGERIFITSSFIQIWETVAERIKMDKRSGTAGGNNYLKFKNAARIYINNNIKDKVK